MSGGLWSLRAEELLSRAASADPTPGGGSVAAIVGAFGVALLQMAVNVTGGAAVAGFGTRLDSLQEVIVAGGDGDVRDFEALMRALRLPRGDDAQREAREAAVVRAMIAATRGPLLLAEALVGALGLSRELEPVIKRAVLSDVLAGRDLIVGAAWAAIRTADSNLVGLERSASSAAREFRVRRNALAAELARTA